MHRGVLNVLFVLLYTQTANSQTPPTAVDQIKAVLEEVKSKGSLKLSTTTDQVAIDAAGLGLKRLSKISVAASIDEKVANLAIGKQLKKDGKFKNPKFIFANEAVDGTIQYTGVISLSGLGSIDLVADLHARMATSVTIDAGEASTDFKIGFAVTALEVSTLKASQNGKPVYGALTGVADFLINGALLPAQATLNHLELRLPTTITAQKELKPSQRPGLITTFEPREIAAKLNVLGFSHIIDNGRIIAVLQEGGTPNNIVGAPKTDGIAALRQEFQKKLTESGVTWMNQGQLSAYVARDLIRDLTSRIMSAGPICMTAKANDLPLPISTKVKLPASEIIDCSPTRNCDPKGSCEQTNNCAQSEECRRCQSAFGRKVCWNDSGCEIGKKTRAASCETGKVAAKARCEATKKAEKDACELIKTGDKAKCEGFKETYDRIRASGENYANVGSEDLLLNGDAKICVTDLSFDPKTLNLRGMLQVAVTSRASGHVKFVPLNIVGHASCFAPVEKALTLSATVPQQTFEIDTTAKFQDDSSQVTLEAKVASPVRFRFPLTALAAKLAADPEFTMLCPVPGTVASVRAVTPESWWPKQARDDMERDLPDFKLDIDLLRRPLVANGLKISGKLRSNEVGIGGVFNVAPK